MIKMDIKGIKMLYYLTDDHNKVLVELGENNFKVATRVNQLDFEMLEDLQEYYSACDEIFNGDISAAYNDLRLILTNEEIKNNNLSSFVNNKECMHLAPFCKHTLYIYGDSIKCAQCGKTYKIPKDLDPVKLLNIILDELKCNSRYKCAIENTAIIICTKRSNKPVAIIFGEVFRSTCRYLYLSYKMAYKLIKQYGKGVRIIYL